jgi:hypothetical protein
LGPWTTLFSRIAFPVRRIHGDKGYRGHNYPVQGLDQRPGPACQQIELILDVAKDEMSPPRHDGDITIRGQRGAPSFQWRFLMAKKPTEARRKLIEFDTQTWHALNLLSRESKKAFQELAEEAFRDLLRKYARPPI